MSDYNIKVVEEAKGMKRASVIDTATGKPWIPPDSSWLSVKFKVSRELPSIKVKIYSLRTAHVVHDWFKQVFDKLGCQDFHSFSRVLCDVRWRVRPGQRYYRA